jgi:hypothetical protein
MKKVTAETEELNNKKKNGRKDSFEILESEGY